MNKKKRIVAFLLTIVLIFGLFSLFSCATPLQYDESEVIARAKYLIENSQRVNEMLYGRGISYIINESTRDGNYFQADDLHLATLGVETVGDIEDLVRALYSPALASSMINTTLGSINDGDNLASLARYYQKYNALTGEPECIMVYKDATVFLKDEITYDLTSVKVLGSDEKSVKASVLATVVSPEGKSQTREIKISLVPSDSGYLLDSHTYARYFDRDKYDELQNQNNF